MKALVLNATIVKEGASREDARADNGAPVSLPQYPTKAQYEEGHLFEVVETPKPTGGKARKLPMILVGGVPTTQWALVPYTQEDIEEHRTGRRENLKQKRRDAVAGGTSSGGFPVRTDASTRSALIEALAEADLSPGDTFDWQLGDGSWMTLNYGEIRAFHAATKTHVQASFSHQRFLDEQLLTATTVEEIDAVDIETGWPS